MPGVQKISANMRAISEADYRVLYAAASESFSHWQQAQEYLHELTALKAKPPVTDQATAHALASAHAAIRVLFTMLTIFVVGFLVVVIEAVNR